MLPLAFPWPCVLCEEKVRLKDDLVGNSVKLLLFLVALPPPRKTRAELMKAIDFEYYGYLDEDDGVIVPLEQEYEKKRMSAGDVTIAGTWILSLYCKGNSA